jgi:transcriptional regulator with GAF, ATPase, and Fis domain
VSARLHIGLHGQAGMTEAVVEALTAAGVQLLPLDSHNSQDSGLIFFEAVDETLLARVRRLVAAGPARLLAATPSPAALAQGRVWDLLNAGACDVLHYTDPHVFAQQVLARLRRWQEVDEILASPLVQENCIGSSARWLAFLRQVIEVAAFSDAAILLTGESGTGKELMARLIHTLDRRPDKRDLIVLDCTTIVDSLSGSEFFGHERGAFTSASGERDGAFALADRGTLFLDEVGELPLPLQAELLRVIQERTYKRVGGNQWRSSQFRLVCATNRDLYQEQAEGRFRPDLYYRLAGWVGRLPPLRERPGDILAGAQCFAKQLRPNEAVLDFDDAVRDYLLQGTYPGNMRELKQLVGRLLSRHVGPGPVTVGAIPEDERPRPADASWNANGMCPTIVQALSCGIPLKEIGKQAENLAVRLALELEGHNLQRAARRLGVTDRALQIRRASQRQGAQGLDSSPGDQAAVAS